MNEADGVTEKCDQWAKSTLLRLCSGDDQRTISDIHASIDSNVDYGKAGKELFHERVDEVALSCTDFKYNSTEGQSEHGSFLHLACQCGRFALVDEVVDKLGKASVGKVRQVINSKSRRFRRTPLHEAVLCQRSYQCVSALVRVKVPVCSVSDVDCEGSTPLHLVFATRDGAVTDDISRLMTAKLLLTAASQQGQLQRVSLTKDRKGRTPVDVALGAGHVIGYLDAALSVRTRQGIVTAGIPWNVTVRDFMKNAIRRLLPHIIQDGLAMPDFLQRKAVNFALEIRDLSLNVDVLRCLRNLQKCGRSGAVLTRSSIYSCLEQVKALSYSHPSLHERLVKLIYEVSEGNDLETVHASTKNSTVQFITGSEESTGVLALMCSKDKTMIGCLEPYSLTLALKAALAKNACDLLVKLCTTHNAKTGSCGLLCVDNTIRNNVLRFAWQHRLVDILTCSALAECAAVVAGQETIEVRFSYLLRELEQELHPDVRLITMCTSKDVVKLCSGTIGRTISRVLRRWGHWDLKRVCKTGLLGIASYEAKHYVLLEAAKYNDFDLASICIEAGALRGMNLSQGQSPVDAAKRANHGRLAKFLQKALDDQRLLSHGDEPVNSLLVRVGGPPGAGKSTLVESLKTSWYRYPLRMLMALENQPDEGDRNSLRRTKGINAHVYWDKDGTPYHVLDLGGHGDFATAHPTLHRPRGDSDHQRHCRLVAVRSR